jgi:hypothetical protein
MAAIAPFLHAMKRFLSVILAVLNLQPVYALSWSSEDDVMRLDVAVSADVEGYFAEQPLQGTLGFFDDTIFLQPRLSAFVDFDWEETLQVHLLARWDRGFDPGSAADGEVRLDEYYVDWKPLADDRLALRVGKFATVFGAWVPRHLAWDHAFVTAPLAYDDMLPLTDVAAPLSRSTFAARRDMADVPTTWVPIVWGPSYATGAAISGRLTQLEYALEVKNAALSSRPSTWDAVANGEFRTPVNVTGRLGWHPAAEWTFGSSFSHGPYLQNDDARQTTVGLDAAYAYGHLQVWMEVLYSSFDVPDIGDVWVSSAFLEARYKVSPRWWLAARWNQTWNGDVPGLGSGVTFDRNGWRLDLAAGFRASLRAQFKLQYSLGEKRGRDVVGDHLLALQCTLRL